ncbi:MAG TPA: protein-L-isoaspartate O-methyltransferase, partial [Burkholderiaceae bacterium]|nr:protein-L-isoaspartate O-methyltransferase [Burkholderiaceae bacterium]
ELKTFAEANLRRAGIANATVVQGDGARGYPSSGPLDVIVISGGVPRIPDSYLAQLRIGGRLAAFVGNAPIMSAEIVTRTGEDAYDTVKLFETLVRPLRNVAQPTRFKF